MKLALALRTAAVLRCIVKQRRAATGLPPRWFVTRRYALYSARDASKCQLGVAGRSTAYCGSARLLWEAATRGRGPAAALARHTALRASLCPWRSSPRVAAVLGCLDSSSSCRRGRICLGSTRDTAHLARRVLRAGAGLSDWLAQHVVAVLGSLQSQHQPAAWLHLPSLDAQRGALGPSRIGVLALGIAAEPVFSGRWRGCRCPGSMHNAVSSSRAASRGRPAESGPHNIRRQCLAAWTEQQQQAGAGLRLALYTHVATRMACVWPAYGLRMACVWPAHTAAALRCSRQ